MTTLSHLLHDLSRQANVILQRAHAQGASSRMVQMVDLVLFLHDEIEAVELREAFTGGRS